MNTQNHLQLYVLHCVHTVSSVLTTHNLYAIELNVN